MIRRKYCPDQLCVYGGGRSKQRAVVRTWRTKAIYQLICFTKELLIMKLKRLWEIKDSMIECAFMDVREWIWTRPWSWDKELFGRLREYWAFQNNRKRRPHDLSFLFLPLWSERFCSQARDSQEMVVLWTKSSPGHIWEEAIPQVCRSQSVKGFKD